MKKIYPTILFASIMIFPSCSIMQKITGKKSQSEPVTIEKPVQSAVDSDDQTAFVLPQPVVKEEPKPKRKPSKAQIEQAQNTAVNHPINVDPAAEDRVDLNLTQALNGEWTIQEVHGEKVTGDERPYINFESATGNFYGSNGCNILNGDFTVKSGNKIEFANLISTMKMCANAPFETLINTSLAQASGFILDKSGNESYLKLTAKGNSTPLLVLRRHNLDFLNGAWRVISIDGHRVTAANMKFVIDINELSVHGNAGCNIMNGKIVIDPDSPNSIQFSNLITTRMMCPDIQQETEFLVALEEVTNCVNLGNGRVELRNRAGNEKIVILSIDPASIDQD